MACEEEMANLNRSYWCQERAYYSLVVCCPNNDIHRAHKATRKIHGVEIFWIFPRRDARVVAFSVYGMLALGTRVVNSTFSLLLIDRDPDMFCYFVILHAVPAARVPHKSNKQNADMMTSVHVAGVGKSCTDWLEVIILKRSWERLSGTRSRSHRQCFSGCCRTLTA